MSETSPSPAPDALVGSTLGSYRLVRLLGSGGMGNVYEGVHPIIGARVAIKVLLPEVASIPAVVERFFNEARAVNLIGHRNVVKIIDLAAAEGRHYCVMELLEGQSLSARLASAERMPFTEAAPILLQCAEALGAAHDRSIVHRDIKPDNIFLVSEPGQPSQVKILDFGIAKLATPGLDVARTTAGVVMGTPAFMSPEQAEGAAEKMDGRSDIYSLGVVMFQMATGSLPFPEPTHVRVMMAHVTTQPPRPSALAPRTPVQFERIILRCLAKNREERFQSMRELRDALQAALQEVSLGVETAGAAGPVDGSRAAWQMAGDLATERSLPGLAKADSRPTVAGSTPAPMLRDAPAPIRDAPAPMLRDAPVPMLRGAPLPATGSGLPDEPLPGAEMFEPVPPKLAARELPRPIVAPPPEEPLELDLPPVPPPPQEPVDAPAPAPRLGRRALIGAAAVLAVALFAAAAWKMSGESATPPSPLPAELTCPTQAAPPVAQPIDLQIITVPAGARVRAQWEPNGCALGTAPWHLSVPKNARVRLRYQLAGHPPRDTEEPADAPRVVLESLAE